MFVQDNLQAAKVVIDTNFPNTKFFIMFIGVVMGPFLLFAIGGHASGGDWQTDLMWAVPAMALLAISAGVGLMLFKRHSLAEVPPSIRATYG
ncbi:MAG: hypothetical protein SF339_07250 [Blastocatellia bacterium]|nr:hypothetical protein [Blastocatellia bacterium]